MLGVNLVVLSSFILLTILFAQLLNQKHRWIILLINSVVFYVFLVDSKVLVLLLMWLVTYFIGPIVKQKKLHLRTAVPIILTPLVIGKIGRVDNHFEAFVSKNIDVSSSLNWFGYFEIMGLSYFTFLAISYLTDLNRGYVLPEKNAFKLLLYLSYFPTIFSGPLHRYKYLSEKFNHVKVTDKSFTNGSRLLLWGFFKSLVVAPRIFKMLYLLNSNGISGYYYLIIGLLFFLYLYISFSSFVEIFQGVSEIFSIKLKDNFRPRIYTSHSRQNFWNGWHITLNEWFRDYFFFPLAMKSKNPRYIEFALLCTFFLIAMWHEVSSAMVIWGLMNGLWIVVEKRVPFERWPFGNLRKILGVVYHLFLASILALIFITPNPSELLNKLVSKPSLPLEAIWGLNLPITITCFIIMDLYSKLSTNKRMDEAIGQSKTYFRWMTYLLFILLILVFGETGQIENYYIQF